MILGIIIIYFETLEDEVKARMALVQCSQSQVDMHILVEHCQETAEMARTTPAPPAARLGAVLLSVAASLFYVFFRI